MTAISGCANVADVDGETKMTDGPEKLVLALLRRIDARVAGVETVLREHTVRLAHIDEILGQMQRRQVIEAERFAMESARIDRKGADIERLKRRFDIVD